jgi:hypothetical protein
MLVRVLLFTLVAAGGFAPAMAAPTADEVRGGWIADADGQRHIYLFNVRGTDVRGIYCRDCSEPRNLAFVESGRIEGDGFSFVLVHDGAPAPYRENVKGRIVDGRLIVSAQRQGSNARPSEMTFMREPRRPRDGVVLPGAIAPLPAGVAAPAGPPLMPVIPAPAITRTPPPDFPQPGAAGPGGRGRGYVSPAPAESLTAAKISGLWLWGGGPGKQYFIFRQVGTGNNLRGMVCGPCDNPFTFGVLADGVLADSTTFRFNIVHEDWGAAVENGPFNNQVVAKVSRNEMRIVTRQDNRPETTPTVDMTLLGPIRTNE